MTASVMYNRPLAHGNWASTLVWGRNVNLPARGVNVTVQREELHLGRIENVDRTNELLFGKIVELPGFQEILSGEYKHTQQGMTETSISCRTLQPR